MDEGSGSVHARIALVAKEVRVLPKEFTVSFIVRPWLWLVSPFAVLAGVWMVYLPWESNSAPAWVQAVGSVAAIFTAWMIPYLHEQRRLEREKNQIFDSAGWLALRLENSLQHMESVLDRAAEEDAQQLVNQWLFLGQEDEWVLHEKAASELPMSAFTGADISYLLAIRSTAVFGAKCARIICSWDFAASPDIRGDFPLYDRISFHKGQISWALTHTLYRPGTNHPKRKPIGVTEGRLE